MKTLIAIISSISDWEAKVVASHIGAEEVIIVSTHPVDTLFTNSVVDRDVYDARQKIDVLVNHHSSDSDEVFIYISSEANTQVAAAAFEVVADKKLYRLFVSKEDDWKIVFQAPPGEALPSWGEKLAPTVAFDDFKRSVKVNKVRSKKGDFFIVKDAGSVSDIVVSPSGRVFFFVDEDPIEAILAAKTAGEFGAVVSIGRASWKKMFARQFGVANFRSKDEAMEDIAELSHVI